MDSCESLQQKVNDLYIKTFKNNSDLPLCIPLLPRINDAYLKDRIMIIGQETNGWYPDLGKYNDLVHTPDRMVEASLEAYDDFTKYSIVKNSDNIFWIFQKELYKEVFQRDIVDVNGNLGHVWLNVFLMEAVDSYGEQGKSSAVKEIGEEVLKQQDRLLYNLLELLKPRIILFLSGPNQDWVLNQFVFSKKYEEDCLTFSAVPGESSYPSNAFVKVQMKNVIPELAGTKIYRMYHPSYLKFLGKKVMDEYKDDVFNELRKII